MIRTRDEIQDEILTNDILRVKFNGWTQEQQSEFLDFCSGERGVRILYDPFFKEIMNPEYAPERLNELLSLLLGIEVRIMAVLPTDSTRLGSETSLVVMDIVVETARGSLITVEVQKIGYMFSGERSACYSADLLLRQYKRLRDKMKKKFNYKDIKEVYTIVFYENSPSEFQAFPGDYLHYFKQQSDTGLKMNLLLKYIFIPLDIFQKTIHNKPVTNKLDAWLMFLSTDKPKDIIELIEKWPEFREMYGEIYDLCRNTEKVMDMYSKELQELDRNTVQYMIDEMGEEINNLRSENAEQQSQITEQQSQITDLQGENSDLRGKNSDLQEQLEKQEQELKVWKLYKKGCSEKEIASETDLNTELIHEILNNL